MTSLAELGQIVLPEELYLALVGHARRKLAGAYLPDEEHAPKAYGLVGGRVVGDRGDVTHVVPLLRNQRDQPHLKPVVDHVMEDLAVPSETPLERRGWVSDPREILAAEDLFDRAGARLLGGYHMHRVPWDHDPIRDRSTEVDTELARGSGLWTFILSMVDPGAPILRAYFEGDNAREAPIRLTQIRGEAPSA
jgi:hypothetical protein